MKLKHSLAYQLLKVTFSGYVLITVSITVIHMYTVWTQAETFLHADLLKFGNSARQGIVLVLWDLDYVSVFNLTNLKRSSFLFSKLTRTGFRKAARA